MLRKHAYNLLNFRIFLEYTNILYPAPLVLLFWKIYSFTHNLHNLICLNLLQWITVSFLYQKSLKAYSHLILWRCFKDYLEKLKEKLIIILLITKNESTINIHTFWLVFLIAYNLVCPSIKAKLALSCNVFTVLFSTRTLGVHGSVEQPKPAPRLIQDHSCML